MTHEEQLPLCQDFQKEIRIRVDKHLDESGPIRDSVKDHERRIMNLEEYVRKQGDLKLTIIGSSFSVIIVVLLASLGMASSWGTILEKVSRLEQLHPYGTQPIDTQRHPL